MLRHRRPRRVRRPQAAAAVGRPAAACRARTRARQRPARAAARRAARRARPEAPQGDAVRAQEHPARHRDHVRPRHARPGRGDDDGRLHRRHERRPHRAARHARPSSTSIPATAFVANFLGVSNLLAGTVEGPDARAARRRHAAARRARRAERAHGPRLGRDPPGEAARRRRTRRQLADRRDHRARLRRRLDAVRGGDLRGRRDGVRPGGRVAHAGRAAGAVVRAGRNVRRFPTGGESSNERVVHPRSGSAARARRRRVPERSRTARRLRRRRPKSAATTTTGAVAQTMPKTLDVLELAALHRHRREDEVASVARRVREALRRQRQVRRGHQRQRQLLREDRGAALAEPVDRPRHHRADRLLRPARPDDRARLAREARQVGDPEHQEPAAGAAASELGPEPRVQPALAVGHDRHRLRPEARRRRHQVGRRSC